MNAGSAARHIDTLLLLGLPACGKSVIRRYLSALPIRSADTELGIGPTIQLDDYAYVAFMWQIHVIVAKLSDGPIYLDATGQRFEDVRIWDVLIHLLDEDYAALDEPVPPGDQAVEWIVERLERACELAGLGRPFADLAPEVQQAARAGIDEGAKRFAREWSARRRPPGSTVVIEFSRGGPAGMDLPMEAPFGYGHAFSLLSAQILGRAAVLYVWVTPEQSRQRNHARAQPNAQGTILHHAVPDAAMAECYGGGDDMAWLVEHGERPDAITVNAHGATFHLPAARFDNRREIAAFRGDEPAGRPDELDERTRTELRAAFAVLARPASGVPRPATFG